MSYKTDRLVNLIPDAYAVKETESLLYKLLDAVGSELMASDEAVKRLLKSHWVNYASGEALDGLGAIYGVARRQLADETMEPDDAFRQRLKATVPFFTGGGTKKAVIGAVRSSLGLPFDLDQLKLPPAYRNLRDDLERLIYIEEYSPKGERIVGRTVTEVSGASECILEIEMLSVLEELPVILWKFTTGGGRRLFLERLAQVGGAPSEGFKSDDSLFIPPGSTLTFYIKPDNSLGARIGLTDVSSHFKNLDDTTPAIMPEVPLGRSEWKFRSQSGLFEISTFDSDTLSLPLFEVEMNWLRHEPLTFEVHVPYFLKQAVDALTDLYGYPGKLFVFKGLPLTAVADVVDQTRAAGVKASVQFSLNFLDKHEQHETFVVEGQYAITEDAQILENLMVSSLNDAVEYHNAKETFVIGGVFDISPFDNGHGFVN